MTIDDATPLGVGANADVNDDLKRVVSCDLGFVVTESGEVAFQIVAADSAGRIVSERFEAATDGAPPSSLEEIRTPQGGRIHVIHTRPGRLTVAYRAEIETQPARPSHVDPFSSGYERQLYLRPSRYCPSDHLIGFAVAEFRMEADVVSRVASITEWIRDESATCPGRVTCTTRPSTRSSPAWGRAATSLISASRSHGLREFPLGSPPFTHPACSRLDFHAVFETLQDGRWTVHDATGLAPRSSLVRIATGRDAADAAFSAVNSGVMDMEYLGVSATVGALLPRDNDSQIVELA